MSDFSIQGNTQGVQQGDQVFGTNVEGTNTQKTSSPFLTQDTVQASDAPIVLKTYKADAKFPLLTSPQEMKEQDKWTSTEGNDKEIKKGLGAEEDDRTVRKAKKKTANDPEKALVEKYRPPKAPVAGEAAGTGPAAGEADSAEQAAGEAGSAGQTAGIDQTNEMGQAPGITQSEGTETIGRSLPLATEGPMRSPTDGMEFSRNLQALGEEFVANLTEIVNSMPEGPDKVRFADFLKSISEALQEFQTMLHEMTSADSNKAKEWAHAQAAASQERYDKYVQQQAEIKQKYEDANKKMAPLKPLMKGMGIAGIVMTAIMIYAFAPALILSGPVGWLALSLMVAMLVDSVLKHRGETMDLNGDWSVSKAEKDEFGNTKNAGLFGELMEIVDYVNSEIIEMFGGDLDDQAMKDMKLFLKTLSMAIMIGLVSPYIPFGASTGVLSMIESSNIVKDIVTRSYVSIHNIDPNNISEKDQEAIDEQVFRCQMATMALVLVVAIAGVFFTGGGSSGVAAASAAQAGANAGAQAVRQSVTTLEKIARTLETWAQKIIETIKKAQSVMTRLERIDIASKVSKLERIGLYTARSVVRVVRDPQNWVTATGVSLQGTMAVSSYNYHQIMGDIAKLKGELDAEMEEKDAFIMQLKKIIQKLLEALQGTGDLLSQTGDLQRNMYQGLSQNTDYSG